MQTIHNLCCFYLFYIPFHKLCLRASLKHQKSICCISIPSHFYIFPNSFLLVTPGSIETTAERRKQNRVVATAIYRKASACKIYFPGVKSSAFVCLALERGINRTKPQRSNAFWDDCSVLRYEFNTQQKRCISSNWPRNPLVMPTAQSFSTHSIRADHFSWRCRHQKLQVTGNITGDGNHRNFPAMTCHQWYFNLNRNCAILLIKRRAPLHHAVMGLGFCNPNPIL